MKPIYVIDYTVVDTLGLDIESNYVNMMSLAKGPQTVTRYDVEKWPNVACTKGYEISEYPTENLLPRLLGDLVNQLSAKNKIPKETAVIFGAFASSSANAISTPFREAIESGATRFSPVRLFTNNHDLLSASISKRLQLEGQSTSLNAACSSSMFNLHYAFMCLQTGALNSALVGSMETPLSQYTQFYWQSTSAISTKNGGICKPFDKSRDGFIQAEGGSLWWLCDEETVKKYDLKPKAQILSVAVSSKCYGSATITAHDKSCVAQIDTINKALTNSGKTVNDIAFFNAHATSTPVGDDIEFDVFTKVFDNIDIPCVSFKGALGHTMSACGMIESAYGLEALKNGFIHPNYGLDDPLSDDPRLITKTKNINGKTFMKASFGFGGRTVISILESFE